MHPPAPNAAWDDRRISRLEEDYSKLSSKIDGVTAALAAGLSSISTQIAALQVSMPDHYMPRREYDVTIKLLQDRIAAGEVDTKARFKMIETTQQRALLLVIGTLATTLINVGFFALKSLTGHG